MLLIRPVMAGDTEDLYSLSAMAEFGLTSLPRDKKYLSEKISESVRSFRLINEKSRLKKGPSGETYFFVMEDLSSGRIVGTCSIISKVGGFEPFYSYRIKTSVHQSETIKVKKEIQALHLEEEHNGPAEIGSLFLAPDYRKEKNGRFLSYSRFLFMAEFPFLFDEIVIAEMRGVIGKGGRSSFWDALGRHFFDIEFPKADYLSIVNKKFMAELMPRHPIYIPLLPENAQNVIGKVHKNTEPALKILEGQGFQFRGQVDIFEGGPILSCPLKEIRTVKESCRAKVAEITDKLVSNKEHLVSNTKINFLLTRAHLEFIKPENNSDHLMGVRVSDQLALSLKLGIGDEIRYFTLA